MTTHQYFFYDVKNIALKHGSFEEA